LLKESNSLSYKPEHYDLTIEIDFKAKKFHGNVSIVIKFDQITESGEPRAEQNSTARQDDGPNKFDLVLNAGGSLRILAARYALNDEQASQAPISKDVKQICHDNQTQALALRIDEAPKVESRIEVDVQFEGALSNSPESPFGVLPNGKGANWSLLLTNDFYTSRARFAFPSIDRPELRATFDLTLVHNAQMESIAWTPKISETPISGTNKKVVKFERSDPMPCHALAFAIGSKFNKISCLPQGGLSKPLVSAYIPADRRVEEARFMLDTICEAIASLERYFMVPFPFKKLDITTSAFEERAAPEGKASRQRLVSRGVGLLSLSENYLLKSNDDPDELPDDRTALAIRLGLEGLVSQWFGAGLVGTGWTDHWFLEGLVRWRSYMTANEIRPQFDHKLGFILQEHMQTLESMAQSSSGLSARPKQKGSSSRGTEADSKEDSAEEARVQLGASLWNMLEHELGPVLLRDCLSELLQSKWNSTSLLNIVEIFKKNAGQIAADAIVSYSNSSGVPLVHMKLLNESSMQLTQEPLVTGYNAKGTNESAPVTIPMTIFLSDGLQRQDTMQLVFRQRSQTLQLPDWFDGRKAEHWIKSNYHFHGLYRSSYDPEVWSKFGLAIKRKLMSTEDKMNIIDDARTLAEINRLEVQQLETVISWFEGETDGAVLSTLTGSLMSLIEFRERELGQPLDAQVRRLFQNVYDLFRFKIYPEQSLAQLDGRRDALTTLIAKGDHRPPLEEGAYLFEGTSKGTGDELPRFLWEPVFTAVLKRSTVEEPFDDLIGRLQAIRSVIERQKIVEQLVDMIEDEYDERKELLLSTLK